MTRVKYNNIFVQKLHKEFCEIEGCPVTDPCMLHIHHICERKELGTSDDPYNCAVLCSLHHNLLHAKNGQLKIIGVYPSTGKYGRKLIYELDGKCNVEGITEPYFVYQAPQIKITGKLSEKESKK